jgi:hypothetical protein
MRATQDIITESEEYEESKGIIRIEGLDVWML